MSNLIKHAEEEFKRAGYIPLDQEQEDDNMIAVSSDIRDKVVVYLNQCLQEDNKAVQELCADIPVNNLSDANPIVCRINNGVVTTSALGLLNGALEAIYGRPNPVYAVMRSENDSLILRFE